MGDINSAKIKQDINFLEYPLWFLDSKSDGKGFVWSDMEGYEYRSGYKPPDKVDILILLYLLRKSQQEDYTPLLTCTRYEILKNCGFPVNPQYYERLKDSLKRWSNVAIYFQGVFYDGGKYLSKNFHIMKGSISSETMKVEVVLDSDWLLKIKESQYFKYINFELHKVLKRSISRRLHEWLCKNFMGRNKYCIRLTKLGKKLPIQGRKTKEKTVIYASDVMTAIKPAINEINRLAQDPGNVSKIGVEVRDLFRITYEVVGEKQNRVIIFHKHPVVVEENKKIIQVSQADLQSLLGLLKTPTKKIEKAVNEYFQKEGFEYVKWNILYANKNAKKNYSTYLQKALANNWADEWADEEKIRIERQIEEKREEKRRREEEERKLQLRKIGQEQIPIFKKCALELEESVKKELWEKAENEIQENMCRREFVVKLRYAELILANLNESGGGFVKEVLNDFGMVSDIAWKKA